jgi:hypothetical protein
MSKFLINFNDYDHSFCEAKIYGYPPEYFNSITSLFISLIGLMGFILNDLPTKISMIYYAFIINGLTSFMYHFTNSIGWGLMDRFSMVLIAFNVVYAMSGIVEDFLGNEAKCIYDFISIVFFTVLLTITGLHNETIFNVLFGVFLCLPLFLMLVVSLTNVKKYFPLKIIRYGWYGIALIAIAGISWILTENLCNTYPIMKFLMGHAIWHCCVGLGGYYLSLLLLYYELSSSIDYMDYYFGIPYFITA